MNTKFEFAYPLKFVRGDKTAIGDGKGQEAAGVAAGTGERVARQPGKEREGSADCSKRVNFKSI